MTSKDAPLLELECPCCPARYTVKAGDEVTCTSCGTTVANAARPYERRLKNWSSAAGIFRHHGSGMQ